MQFETLFVIICIGIPGESLPRMGALTPMEPDPRGKKFKV
jgi:hypothetical protein